MCTIHVYKVFITCELTATSSQSALLCTVRHVHDDAPPPDVYIRNSNALSQVYLIEIRPSKEYISPHTGCVTQFNRSTRCFNRSSAKSTWIKKVE